jgi:branched-chain amino acid transport system substrate-binding protein
MDVDGWVGMLVNATATWPSSYLVGVVIVVTLVLVLEGRIFSFIDLRANDIGSWLLRTMLTPMLPVALGALAIRYFDIPVGGPQAANILDFVRVGLWLVVAWAAVRAINLFVWDRVFHRRAGIEVPRLLPTLTAISVYVFALYGIVAFVFHRPVLGLAVSSGVVVGVVGLAMQGTLSDLISGITISLDRPYKIGDWISLPNDRVGRVVDMTWRSTRLQSRNNTIHVIPNSVAARETIENLSAPDESFGAGFHVSITHDIAPVEVRRLLLQAALGSEYVLRDPPPVVRLLDGGKRPFVYLVFVHFRDYQSLYLGTDDVFSQIWTHLDHAGIRPAAVGQDLSLARGHAGTFRQMDVAQVLAGIPLFGGLQEEEIQSLSRHSRRQAFTAGTQIIAEGDPGQSLFIVLGGMVRITRRHNGETLTIRELGLADFFGEMSLLTGESRAATVSAVTECHVLEIDKSVMQPLLINRPELVDVLAEVIARRKLDQITSVEKRPADGLVSWLNRVTSDTAGTIRHFFGMRALARDDSRQRAYPAVFDHEIHDLGSGDDHDTDAG